MKFIVAAVAAISAVALAAPEARASVVSRSFDITASGFTDLGDTTPPTDPVYLDFTLTIDPSQSYPAGMVGLTVNKFNLSDPVSFAYYAPDEALTLSTGPEYSACSFGSGGFCTILYPAFSGSPIHDYVFTYITSGGVTWNATSIVAIAVPEPFTWAMMLVGVGTVGAISRTRRRRLA
jgi:hypothetical protein